MNASDAGRGFTSRAPIAGIKMNGFEHDAVAATAGCIIPLWDGWSTACDPEPWK